MRFTNIYFAQPRSSVRQERTGQLRYATQAIQPEVVMRVIHREGKGKPRSGLLHDISFTD